MERVVLIIGLILTFLLSFAIFFPTYAYVAVCMLGYYISNIANILPGYQHGVYHGENNFRKSLYYTSTYPVYSMQVGHFTSDCRYEIALCGFEKCDIIDAVTKKIVKSFNLNFSADESISGYSVFKYNNAYRIISRGGGYGNVGLIDDKQRHIWDTPIRNQKTILEYCGDNSEALYCFFHNNEISIINDHGETLNTWVAGKEEIFSAEVFYSDQNTPILVTGWYNTWRSKKEGIAFWDRNGRLINKFIPEESSFFSIIRWPHNNNIMLKDETHILILDFAGNEVLSYRKPYFLLPFLEIINVHPITIRQKGENISYLCVLAKIRGFRDALLIFDNNGTNVYQEVTGNLSSLAALPNTDGSESLLIAEDKKIWIYN